ncbi:MAG TPA: hypothetical protein VHW43_07860 [Puia sp.]|jgi:hypothetical protein|nr:hypothetical protein [Puia sp.]
MKKKQAERTRHMNIALTPEEYDLLQAKFRSTTFREFSSYVRSVLFNTPVITRYHNCSLDEFVILSGGVQGQLDAIRRSFTRAVNDLQKRPPTQEITDTLTILLSAQFEVTANINEIKTFFLKIYEHARNDQTLRGNGKPPLL